MKTMKKITTVSAFIAISLMQGDPIKWGEFITPTQFKTLTQGTGFGQEDYDVAKSGISNPILFDTLFKANFLVYWKMSEDVLEETYRDLLRHEGEIPEMSICLAIIKQIAKKRGIILLGAPTVPAQSATMFRLEEKHASVSAVAAASCPQPAWLAVAPVATSASSQQDTDAFTVRRNAVEAFNRNKLSEEADVLFGLINKDFEEFNDHDFFDVDKAVDILEIYSSVLNACDFEKITNSKIRENSKFKELYAKKQQEENDDDWGEVDLMDDIDKMSLRT